MLIHVLKRTVKSAGMCIILLVLTSCMVRSGAQMQTMQPAPGEYAWAFAVVGADGIAERVYADLRPNATYQVIMSGQVSLGAMQLVLLDERRQPAVTLAINAGDVVSTQAVVKSSDAGQIIVTEYMQAVRKGEYQIWVRPLDTP